MDEVKDWAEYVFIFEWKKQSFLWLFPKKQFDNKNNESIHMLKKVNCKTC